MRAEQATNKSMESDGIVFGFTDSMGNHSSTLAARHQQSEHNFLRFFSRLGNYNVYNILPPSKKMAAIVVKLSIWLTNIFGVSLFVYWLAIDFAGIKIFLTSIGVFIYGGMKLYEKYLDVKEKKRKMNEHDHTPRKKTFRITKNK